MPSISFAQSPVVIWAEDFSGYLNSESPTQGKNATYNFEGNYKCTADYGNSVGNKLPSLSISKGCSFISKISLYGASGNLTLTFSVNKPDKISVYTVNGKNNTLLVKDSVHNNIIYYNIRVSKGTDILTLKFKADSKTNIYVDDIKIVGQNDCRPTEKDSGISFPDDNVTTVLGDEFSSQKLSNPTNLKVSYWSSDKTIATVDENGIVTPKSIGYTTISAIFTGDATYGYKEVSYVLHVNRRVPEGEVFYESFDKCLSIGGNDNNFSSYSMSDNSSSFDNSSGGGTPLMGYKCVVLDKGQTYTTGPVNGGSGFISFKVAGGNKASSNVSVTYGKKSSTCPVGKEKWTICSVPFNNVSANTKFTLSGTDIYIDSVSIVIFPESITLKVGNTGYASLYYNNFALKVPAGVNAYTMKVVGNKIKDSHRFVSGDIIPKATGVIVKGASNEYAFSVAYDDGFVDEANQLKGSDFSEMTTGGSVYYMLAAPDGKVGYYWGAADGGAFKSGAHKAYLALPSKLSARAAKGYAFDIDDDATGIDAHYGKQQTKDEYSYNVMGQRIDDASYKGLIIRNGKKFIKR